MTFNHEEESIQDLFENKLVEWCENKSSNDDYGVFETDEILLKELNEREVLFFKVY